MIKEFIKKETVFCISLLLAVVSAFFVHPDTAYMDYIDFRVLVLLFSLMSVMNGLQALGIFEKLSYSLLKYVHSTRSLTLLLVGLCFFTSMLITNDVALITFVPFTLLTFDKIEQKNSMIYVIVLETIGANLGSMMTPVGNPQNLYLYGLSGYSLTEFVVYMAPLTTLSLVLLFISCVIPKNNALEIGVAQKETTKASAFKLCYYFVLFIACLVCVAHILPYPYLLFSIPVLLFLDRKSLKQVDYCLLLTFLCFFIFIGNMQRVPAIAKTISDILTGRELLVSFLCSQVISNVPAAILLSGFTDQIPALLYGVNIGGLGTLIASLASLISFKYFSNHCPNKKGKYMIQFTVMNLIFALILLCFVI